MKYGVDNELKANVAFIREGAVNATAELDLATGEIVLSNITMEGVRKFCLKVNDCAYACFNAADVIVAVPD